MLLLLQVLLLLILRGATCSSSRFHEVLAHFLLFNSLFFCIVTLIVATALVVDETRICVDVALSIAQFDCSVLVLVSMATF